MKLIKQRGKFDCGIACLAMLLGIEYEEAEREIGRDVSIELPEFFPGEQWQRCGLLLEEVSCVLFERGVAHYRFYGEEQYRKGSEWLCRMLTERPGYLRMPTTTHLDRLINERGCVAMLGVPSKNMPNAGHYIVMRAGEVLDPSPLENYQWGEPIPVHEAVIVKPPGVDLR